MICRGLEKRNVPFYYRSANFVSKSISMSYSFRLLLSVRANIRHQSDACFYVESLYKVLLDVKKALGVDFYASVLRVVSMPIGVGFGLVVGAIISASMASKSAKHNLEYQKERDAKDYSQREEQGEKNRQFHKEQADIQYQRTLDAIDYQSAQGREANAFPLRVPAITLESYANSHAIRAFIVPPSHITIRGSVTDAAWNSVHTNDLVESIRHFIQRHYGSQSPRPIDLYEPDILNPQGQRGNNAIRVLQRELSSQPSLT